MLTRDQERLPMLGVSVPDLGLQREQQRNSLIQRALRLVFSVSEAVLYSRAKLEGPGLSLRTRAQRRKPGARSGVLPPVLPSSLRPTS